MNTHRTLSRTLSTLVAAGSLFAATDAAASPCAAPEGLLISEMSIPSWQATQGSWSKLADDGDSESHCWVKDVVFENQYPQVLLEAAGDWYMFYGVDCNFENLSLGVLIGDAPEPGNPATLNDVVSKRMLTIEVTADDAYYVDLNGSIPVGDDDLSHNRSTVYQQLAYGGENTVNIYAWDIYGGSAAMAASIEIEGCPNLLLTGQEDWQYDTSPFTPSGTSGDAFFVADAWFGNLAQDGADYIWWSPDNVQDLGGAQFFLDFYVP